MASGTNLTATASSTAPTNIVLPRVVIKFCTQCRWMLRAAYFGQELLSTFGTSIGEIALQPATGGLFCVELTYDVNHPAAIVASENTENKIIVKKDVEIKEVLLWDRKAEGGFPETKVLKQRVRDHLEPNRDLGHSDKGGKKKKEEKSESETAAATSIPTEKQQECEDCK